MVVTTLIWTTAFRTVEWWIEDSLIVQPLFERIGRGVCIRPDFPCNPLLQNRLAVWGQEIASKDLAKIEILSWIERIVVCRHPSIDGAGWNVVS